MSLYDIILYKLMSEEILKLKLEVEKSNTEFRHWIRNEMQKLYTWLDIKMDKQLTEIKTEMRDGFDKMTTMLDAKFEKLPNYFATKEEHSSNVLEIKYMKERQARTDKIFAFIASIIWTAVIWAILTLIIKTNV